MAERVIRIAIDSAPAEAGARRVVRSLDAIAGKSREAAEAIGHVESSLQRLEQLSRSADTWLGDLADKIGHLRQAMDSLAEETRDLQSMAGSGVVSAFPKSGSDLADLKEFFAELTGMSLAVETVLELANSFERLSTALPVIGRLLTVARSFTAVGLIGTVAIEIVELVRSIKQLDGVDRDYLALLEQVNDLMKSRGEVTKDAVEAVRGAVQRNIAQELGYLKNERDLLADVIQKRDIYLRSPPDPEFARMQAPLIFDPEISIANANIAEIEGKLEKLTGVFGLLDQLLETVESRSAGVTQSSEALGAALETQRTRVEALSRETESATEASRRHGEAVAETGDRLLEAMPNLQAAQEEVLRSGRELGEGARRAFADFADAATDAGAQIEQTIGNALVGLEDALAGFVRTGKLEWKSLVDAMIADLIRLFIRSQILGPLAQGLGGLFGGGSLGPQFAGTGTEGLLSAGSFAQGGSFTVSGSGAPDSRVVAFRATPGERVTVTPFGRDAPAVNSITVVNASGGEVETEERPNASGGLDTVIRVLKRDVERDILDGGRINRAIAAGFGLRAAPVNR